MNKLFKMFTNINNSSGNASGIGLGLFISKKISLKLNFQEDKGLQAESEYQKGTTFSFILEDKEYVVKKKKKES